jgi:hypothetical protein
VSEDDARNPAECPPGESLTKWLHRGPRKSQSAPRSRAERNLHDRIINEVAKLVPDAIKQARAGKPALLRMILRATR